MTVPSEFRVEDVRGWSADENAAYREWYLALGPNWGTWDAGDAARAGFVSGRRSLRAEVERLRVLLEDLRPIVAHAVARNNIEWALPAIDAALNGGA